MKIRARKEGALGRDIPSGKPAAQSRVSLRHSPFLTALQETMDERDEESLARSFAAIDEAAEALRRSVTLRNLKRYKELVREFIRMLTARAYAVQREAGFDRYGHRRLYTIVARINAQLEALTREIMEAQSDQLEWVSRLDEIRGLLLDIYS
ncbi:MAG: YaaR family protein [Firmicutes bacterium]|nr:YaaR family protein [Bacillota bacterium]